MTYFESQNKTYNHKMPNNVMKCNGSNHSFPLPLYMSSQTRSDRMQICKHCNHLEQIWSEVGYLHIFVLQIWKHIRMRSFQNLNCWWYIKIIASPTNEAKYMLDFKFPNVSLKLARLQYQIKRKIKSGHTLRHICPKNLAEREDPPCFFTLLLGVNNHDVSILSDIINSWLPITLFW